MAEIETLDTIKLFYCYHHADKILRDTLENHLAGLKRERSVESWSDLEVSPGTEYDAQVQEHLRSADIILLLVSAPFLASDYCYDILMKLALQRHYAGEALVVPILLRPVVWKDTPLERLARLCPMLPSPEKAVTDSSWRGEDAAFENVVNGIRKLLKDAWLKKGDAHYKEKCYEPALAAFEQAIELDPEFGSAYSRKGCVLHDLGRKLLKDAEYYPKAKACFEAALERNPMDAYTHYLLGNLFYDSLDYEAAILSFERAIQLNHVLISAHIYKGLALEQQGNIKEALIVYDKYLELHPHDPLITYFRRELLGRLEAKHVSTGMQNIVNRFIRYMEDFSRSLHTNEEPMQTFIGTILHFRRGLHTFERDAERLVREYASWLGSLRKMLESIPIQQYDTIENPEIRTLLLALVGTETKHLDSRTRLISHIYKYLRNLIQQPDYDISRFFRDWDGVLDKIIDELEEQRQQSRQFLDTLQRTDTEGLFSE